MEHHTLKEFGSLRNVMAKTWKCLNNWCHQSGNYAAVLLMKISCTSAPHVILVSSPSGSSLKTVSEKTLSWSRLGERAPKCSQTSSLQMKLQLKSPLILTTTKNTVRSLRVTKELNIAVDHTTMVRSNFTQHSTMPCVNATWVFSRNRISILQSSMLNRLLRQGKKLNWREVTKCLKWSLILMDLWISPVSILASLRLKTFRLKIITFHIFGTRCSPINFTYK